MRQRALGLALVLCACAQPALPGYGLRGSPGVAVRQRAWMSPGARRIKRLLYVSDLETNDVFVYDFATGALVGTLTGFDYPRGECVDKKGDVWIANYAGFYVIEYAHGGSTPLRTLRTGAYGIGCAVDPTTGNLAVSIFNAYVLVWKKARGTPREYYSGSCMWFLEPGYDALGNLYVESGNKNEQIQICELPHGSTTMVAVQNNVPIDYEAGTMWDGKYITFADQDVGGTGSSGIYQAKRTASGLELVGKTVLDDSTCGGSDVEQPFIVGAKNTPENRKQGTVAIGNNYFCHYRVDFWGYPGGGSPATQLGNAPEIPSGQAVSIAE